MRPRLPFATLAISVTISAAVCAAPAVGQPRAPLGRGTASVPRRQDIPVERARRENCPPTGKFFDVNRHAIAASGDTGGYVAELNLVLKSGGGRGRGRTGLGESVPVLTPGTQER
jgi:hypothetical protein